MNSEDNPLKRKTNRIYPAPRGKKKEIASLEILWESPVIEARGVPMNEERHKERSPLVILPLEEP